MKYILALDQGTTSSRAILFNEQSETVAKSQNEFTQIYPEPGWVEHDPLEILYSQMRAAADAVILSGVDVKDIAAIGITNQRETTIVWDKATGRPVYNAIVWQCRRTAPICEELIGRGLSEYITEKTGLLIDAYFSATKIKWILDHVSGARERAERGELLFGTIDTWLIWNLTGGKSHVTDYSNAARTMLFDIDALCWDAKLCEELEIPMSMLPKVLPSGAEFGIVAEGLTGLESLAGIPILGVAGDQQAALFGQACFTPGDTKCTYGTGCFLVMNTGETSIRSKNRLLSTIAWGLDGKVEYALEGSIFNAGSVIKWLRDELRIISTAQECSELSESIPDTGGLFFVPAFTGLGAPHWDMYARGTMVGMTRGTGRAQIARSVMESIVYQVKDLISAMQEDSGFCVQELKVDGGASVSNVMMQFQSDMLPCRVNRPENVETTALGAAYLAGLKAGIWQDKDEIRANWQSERVFENTMQEEKREKLYHSWHRAVERALNWEEC
ncbi:MAG: glycerol kinase GlpK [Clostridia bacterium]|nr:glycerol kinase GlpK [Clostridia bacterium]MBR0026123.1 glycerol kinase GlpK [Clostridia bacterium]